MKLTHAITASLLGLQLIVSAGVMLAPVVALAQNTGGPGTLNTGGPGSLNTGGPGGGSRQLTNPLQVGSISQFVSLLLKAVVAIGVPICVFFVVWAGFKFIAAQGSPHALAEAKDNFFAVIIGIVIFVGAWALAELIVNTLRQIGANV